MQQHEINQLVKKFTNFCCFSHDVAGAARKRAASAGYVQAVVGAIHVDFVNHVNHVKNKEEEIRAKCKE